MKRVVAMLFALVVIGSALVFTIKYNNEKSITNEPPQADVIAPEEVFKPTVTEEESYLLIAEEDYLNLYKLDDNTSLKKSERINPSLFPSSDISNLRKGIEYTSKEDAFAAMENFVG